MKTLITILLASAILVSCNKPTAKDTSAAENESLIMRYYSLFNNHKWDDMANMYAEVVDFKDPSLGKGVVKQTRKQIAEKYTQLNQLFPNINDEVLHMYPSGNNHVVVEFVSTGTAPDGTKFELPICTIFTIEQGKITKDFTYYDNFE